jgi:hypothetical protein
MRGAFLLAAILAVPEGAAADCRQALALALDVSASVDRRERALQAEGLARAFEDEEVRAAFLSAPEAPVAIAVYDWSGAGHQRLILGWTEVTGPDVLDLIAARIRAAPAPWGSRSTGVGAALLFGGLLLAGRPDCRRWTIDVSGDGINNSGPTPRLVSLDGGGRAVTVNALVIGRAVVGVGLDPTLAQLTEWFRREVVRGPGAFVEQADGFEDFADAMRRKLLRELQAPVAFAVP